MPYVALLPVTRKDHLVESAAFHCGTLSPLRSGDG